jgi:hypothetical protein
MNYYYYMCNLYMLCLCTAVASYVFVHCPGRAIELRGKIAHPQD